MQTIARCNGRIVAGKLRFPTSYYQKLISKLRVQQVNPFLQQVNPFLQQVNPFLQQVNPFLQQVNPFLQQVNPFLQQVNPFLQQVNISGEKLEDYILSSARDYFGMRGLLPMNI
jgi:hypothetical protein